MITKAFIKEIPANGDNIFKVEIPLMEDNTQTEAIFNALLCSDPSSYNSYNVGDAVFVSFEDEKLDTAIILGKLFVNVPKTSTSYSILNELKVTDHASLPQSTDIGGYSIVDFINLYNSTLSLNNFDENNLKNYVKWINSQIDTSEGTINMYANKIRVLTGELYDNIISTYDEQPSSKQKEIRETLYFLTTPSSLEKDKIESTSNNEEEDSNNNEEENV